MNTLAPDWHDELPSLAQRRERNELFDGVLDRIRDEVNRRREQEIEQALNRALGEGWTPESLAGRTAHVMATETYLLDGRPLLRFSRPRFSQIGQHLQWSMDVERFDWRPE